MPAISDFISRPRTSSDIALGLPLETDEKTIYPVLRESGSVQDGTQRVDQIGYLEIRDGRSDFVSLEPASRAPFLIPVLATLIFVVLWLLRRARS